jgi:hypothetical protein
MVADMPESAFEKSGRSLAWWLQEVAKSLRDHEDLFIPLSKRVLLLGWEQEGDDEDFVFRAINHPVGLITQGLLEIWFRRKPSDDERLSEDLAPIFTMLTDGTQVAFRHGQVVLASRLVALFRVDREWVETHLLPLFSWSENGLGAKGVWQGFLWSPRLLWPLLLKLKNAFLDTAQHYDGGVSPCHT